MKRWLLPIAAAAAVMLLLGGLWYFAGPGSRGDDTSFAGSGGDTGGDTGDTGRGTGGGGGGGGGGVTGSPGGTDGDPGSGSPGGSPGYVEPGFPGTAEPGSKPPPVEPVPAAPTDPLAVRVDSYYRYDGRHLALSYTIGVPECYGEIATPDVEESARSVTVTLTRVPPKLDGDVACIEIALLKTVDIELDEPLGDRVLRDGSVPGAVVPEGLAPGPETATR